jgi:hypothetical protein
VYRTANITNVSEELASLKADTEGGIVLPLSAEPTLKEETSMSETSAVFTSWVMLYLKECIELVPAL